LLWIVLCQKQNTQDHQGNRLCSHIDLRKIYARIVQLFFVKFLILFCNKGLGGLCFLFHKKQVFCKWC
jgi:hypothetical protein